MRLKFDPDFDGETLDDVFGAHDHGRRQHGYKRQYASEFASMGVACPQGGAWYSGGLEWSEQLEILMKISLTRYVYMGKDLTTPGQLL